jgi:hypothetical protein
LFFAEAWNKFNCLCWSLKQIQYRRRASCPYNDYHELCFQSLLPANAVKHTT